MIDPRAVALTEAFYAWERRGRGWDVHPYPVSLEPPFSTLDWPEARARRIDDTRKETFLSTLLTRSAAEPEEERSPAEPDSPARVDPLEYESLRLLVPSDLEVGLPSTVAWLKSLSTIQHPVALEFVGIDGHVSVELAAAGSDVALAQDAVSSLLPDVASLPVEEPLPGRWDAHAERFAVALEFGLGNEFVVSINRLRDLRVDPLAPIVQALAESDGFATLQVLFQAVRGPTWDEAILHAVLTPDGKPFFADAPELTAHAREKVQSPLCAAECATCRHLSRRGRGLAHRARSCRWTRATLLASGATS